MNFPFFSVNTLIIGSGAASLNAALCLHEHGQRNIAIVTDCWGGGTSNNAGSDKQTYYKLSLAGKIPDSARMMAEDLFAGGCVHGDIALCEAQHSAQAFFNLVRLGVPFPHDRYGAFIGYKTDHDLRGRGTSAGPLTSHLMFETMAGEIRRKGLALFDRHQVISLLTDQEKGEKRVIGAVALDLNDLEKEVYGFVVFNAENIILGTGGPAAMYEASVYPESQWGAAGMAFGAGAIGHNLTESQFGLASVKFRWNLSGTYQQVIPRYVSTDDAGKDEREFLRDFFPDLGSLASAVFLKGYQWPFDPRKVRNYGSSLIDLLVYRERNLKKRRVFLDYTKNPGRGSDETFSFDILSEEARSYLENSKALLPTPIKRLNRMNRPAVELFCDHGIDLENEYLEIDVCAQHNNGGLKGNLWWESNIRHLFPVGEICGTHGVYRPGGSALNAGQVGSLRAALFIVENYGREPMNENLFQKKSGRQVEELFCKAQAMIEKTTAKEKFSAALTVIQKRMSSVAAHVRSLPEVKNACADAHRLYKEMSEGTGVKSSKDLPFAFRVLDTGLSHVLYLEAILEYLKKGGKSRGSFLVLDPEGESPNPGLEKTWRFSLGDEDHFVSRKILEIGLDDKGHIHKKWVDVRPIPEESAWFENIWKDFRDKTIFKR